MTIYEDDCLSIDLPDGWQPLANEQGCYINVGQWGITLVIAEEDPDMSPQQKRAGFAEIFANDPYHDPPSFEAKVFDPFHCGPHTGSRVDKLFQDGIVAFGSYAGMVVDGYYVYVQILGLSPEDTELAWRSIATLRIKDSARDALQARESTLQAELETGSIEAEPKRLNAIDLAKTRTKRFKTWMDHQMVLLMDSESYPEENPFVGAEDVKFVVPCNDRSLWLTSLTEWDVTLEFVVRATPSKPRKVWWQRESHARLSIPTGKLHVEQTTGGLLMEIAVAPGSYRVIARGSCPPNADGRDEDVEKIQVILVPTDES